MLLMIIGLVLFLGMHSTSIVALPLRDRLAGKSELGWKAVYGIVSLIGIVLIAKGYAEARTTTTILYMPPTGLRHLAAVLMLPVFVFFVAPYFPGRIKSTLKHPQLVAVKLWAVSHLLVNGTVADLVLFGSFLAWAVIDRISLKRRPERPVAGLAPAGRNDAIAIVVGLVLYGLFAMVLHQRWIGVAPFG